MLRIFINKKAQTTAEYAILIGLVVAAFVAMQTYVKRGLQGKVKEVTDNFTPNQYEPYYLNSNFISSRATNETESTARGGRVTRTLSQDHSERTGTQTYQAAQPQGQ